MQHQRQPTQNVSYVTRKNKTSSLIKHLVIGLRCRGGRDECRERDGAEQLHGFGADGKLCVDAGLAKSQCLSEGTIDGPVGSAAAVRSLRIGGRVDAWSREEEAAKQGRSKSTGAYQSVDGVDRLKQHSVQLN